MPANIEIKARVHDFETFHQKALQLSNMPCQVIQQEDIFFNCPHGRLKLRLLDGPRGQLVYYLRQDTRGPKHSDYTIFETRDPMLLKTILERAYGVRGVVSKVRRLYLVGQTRVHLDDVAGLGKFMELEVVLQPGQADTEGQAIAKDLMSLLGVNDSDLIESAYMDLIEK